MLSRNKVVLTEVGAGVKYYIFLAFIYNTVVFFLKSNPSLIGRVVVFETIGIGSNPMGFVILYILR
jgi:hypothetical protein